MQPGTSREESGRARLPHRRAARLALPAIASHITVPLVGLIDTAMLGHFSDAANLGAVGMGAAVVASVFWVFAFLRAGTTSLVGRSLGAGRPQDAVRHLQRALALAAALGVGWLVLQWIIVPALLRVLAHDSSVGPIATDYALIRGGSLPAVLITLAIVGYLIGAQDTRTPALVAVVIAGANVVFNSFTIVLMGWGAPGAAWATFAAEWTGAALAVLFLRRRLNAHEWSSLVRWRRSGLRHGWGALASMNSSLVLRTLLLMGAVTATASLGSRVGDNTLAANAIVLQLVLFSAYTLDGYATAAETMAAHQIGARNVAAFHRAVAATALASAGIAAVLTVVWWWGRVPILAALTGIPEVSAAASAVWWAVVALPVVSAGAWLLDGVFLGAGRTGWMLVSMGFSVLGVFVPLVAASIGAEVFTNGWLWSAFVAMNAVRALSLGVVYARLSRLNRWLPVHGEQASAAR